MIYIKGGEDYPNYYFDETDPTPFADVVLENGGLPISSRTLGEMWRDRNNEVRYATSQRISIARRHPKRREYRVVVEYLDVLDAQIKRVGDMAIQHARLLSLGEVDS